MIMMSTRGCGLYRRFLLGSVTAKVLHDSDCPVWTTTHIEEAPPAQPVSCRKIACAVDLGPHTERVLSWASRLASGIDARLLVIHVTEDPRPFVAEAFAVDPRIELAERATEEIKTIEHA